MLQIQYTQHCAVKQISLLFSQNELIRNFVRWITIMKVKN
jgi:hypothetical protein